MALTYGVDDQPFTFQVGPAMEGVEFVGDKVVNPGRPVYVPSVQDLILAEMKQHTELLRILVENTRPSAL